MLARTKEEFRKRIGRRKRSTYRKEQVSWKEYDRKRLSRRKEEYRRSKEIIGYGWLGGMRE